jgi:inorganic pyrophosphatase
MPSRNGGARGGGASVRLDRMAPFDEEGRLRVVVESPRGSRIKFVFDEESGAFTLSRTLSAGVVFPFDFGFVPGTHAEDGDPLDALVLHESHTFPGVVVPSTPVGVVEIEQSEDDGKRVRNDRLIVIPAEDPIAAAEHGRQTLTSRRKKELEEFFHSASLFEGKDIEVLGWRGADTALKLIDRARIARRGKAKKRSGKRRR